jgi:PTS system mannose-specific IID component
LRALTGWTQWRVFSRSLFIQAGFNSEGMQSLGLLYALYPALQELYPEPAQLQQAARRHLAAFNTHPYVAAAIIGGVLFHERRIVDGEEPPEQVTQFKRALMGPLAAMGDGFFWLSLKPACGALAVVTVPWLGAWSALLFLVLYNLVHLTARAYLFGLGMRRGDQMVQQLARLDIPWWSEKLRGVAAGCAGGLAAFLAIEYGAQQGGMGAPLLAGGCLSFGVLAWVLVARARLSPYLMLYSAALFSGVLGALL